MTIRADCNESGINRFNFLVFIVTVFLYLNTKQNHQRMKLSFCCSLVLFTLITTTAFSQTKPIEFRDAQKNFRLLLPPNWQKQEANGNLVLYYIAPGFSVNDPDAPSFFIETGTMSAGYETITIDSLAVLEKAITEKTSKKIEFISSVIDQLQNIKWWKSRLSFHVTKKESTEYLKFKTIHNKRTYTITYKAGNSNFDTYMAFIMQYVKSFMFLTYDATLYDGETKDPVDKYSSQLQSIKGIYNQRLSNGIDTWITIASDDNKNFTITEKRSLIQYGKTNSFEAVMRLDTIDEGYFQVYDDEVKKADSGIFWLKINYSLTPVKDAKNNITKLRGLAFFSDTAMGMYQVELLNQQPVVVVTKDNKTNPPAPPPAKDESVKFVYDSLHKPYKYYLLNYDNKGYSIRNNKPVTVGTPVSILEFGQHRMLTGFKTTTAIKGKVDDESIYEYFTYLDKKPSLVSSFVFPLAVTGIKNAEYKTISHTQITNKTELDSIAKWVRQSKNVTDFIKKIQYRWDENGLPAISKLKMEAYTVDIPGLEAILVVYQSQTPFEQLPYQFIAMVINKKVYPVSGECSNVTDIYKLGNNYFLRSEWESCSGDDSESAIYEIRPKGLITEVDK